MNETQIDLWNKLGKNTTLDEMQEYIKNICDIRGFSKQEIEKTMLILVEEVGELAKAIRKEATDIRIDEEKINNYDTIENEVADVCFVLNMLCNQLNVNILSSIKNKEEKNIKRTWK